MTAPIGGGKVHDLPPIYQGRIDTSNSKQPLFIASSILWEESNGYAIELSPSRAKLDPARFVKIGIKSPDGKVTEVYLDVNSVASKQGLRPQTARKNIVEGNLANYLSGEDDQLDDEADI